ncbi:unnamed protein product [Chrysodeixis includens]|uniref:Uncharacterized protein n=1 Tax=Chrysodeixis includens TaxID=689277 RepID=A0A9N8PYP4_CHRIL|nr:unnamed protein product [Chrysodeixis includens]
MMVETILESSQDFGMSNGSLPQWKRELLQRRAARTRPSQPPPQPPPPPPPQPQHDDEDEELRYGPGIVKRLKSRYLSLALRDAPRRRPSVLRRAASLEHLLDERPPPAPTSRSHPRPPRPASVAVPPAPLASAARRDSVKRARSVDALSRLDTRDEPRAPSPSPPPPPLAPRPPPQPRAARPPRRPTPLLRETERPPPDVVRSTLRKFESAPTRRAAPAARVSAVLRGFEGARTSTPEPHDLSDAPPLSPRSPSPVPPSEPMSPVPVTPIANEELEIITEPAGARQVSRAALDGIARAGLTVRYAFEAPRAASHLPPLAATNQVLLGRARRVGVIRPMPARAADVSSDETLEDLEEKTPEHTRLASASPPPTECDQTPPGRTERREPPPAALVEPIPRPPPEVTRPVSPPEPAPLDRSPSPEPKPKPKLDAVSGPLLNGHVATERPPEVKAAVSRIGAAGIERAWSGSGDKSAEKRESGGCAWARASGGGSPAAARRPRAPPPASTSVVFNFSNRKEVPDYIENDGIILRASRRNRIKAGEPGVVVLRPEALARDAGSDSECEPDGAPPSPCAVRFVNDNVLINGRSSMPARPDRDRIAKLKLQFDDSLTRTFEYPSETSLCEDSPSLPAGQGAEGAGAPGAADAGEPGAGAAPPQLAESPLHAPLAANTHISSAALSRYTPHKTPAAAFQLGVTRRADPMERRSPSPPADGGAVGCSGRGAAAGAGGAAGGEGDARPCGADARSWSDARSHTTDLLF